VISLLHDRFIHVPIELLAAQKKRVDPDGSEWQAVLASVHRAAGEIRRRLTHPLLLCESVRFR
jgi:hypothetical protein